MAQTIAAQTDLWLSNKEIESACWWYSNTHPQLLTSSPNSKPCFLTCVLPISSFHLKKYSNPLKRPVLRNHSSCHSFICFFMTSLYVVNHYRKLNQYLICGLNAECWKTFFSTKLLLQAAISAGGWNITVCLCEIFSSPFPSSMTVAHSFLGSLRKLRLFRAIIYKL